MGLSITAYSCLELIVEQDGPDERCDDIYQRAADKLGLDLYDVEDELRWIFAYSGFEARLAPFKPGLYQPSGEVGGDGLSWSYSGYNRWRNALSLARFGKVAREIWALPEQYLSDPVAELVHFADNEGTLGTHTCRRLLAEFEAWSGPFPERWEHYKGDHKQEWIDALRIASKGGGLVFS